MLYGAIIGDIAGSRFEFNNYKGESIDRADLFAIEDEITDDTIMTVAVADAVFGNHDITKLKEDVISAMRGYGRMFPNVSWGGRFRSWIFGDDPQPYNSFGNGAAMRVSACGWCARSLADVQVLTYLVTSVSHDHPEGLKGG